MTLIEASNPNEGSYVAKFTIHQNSNSKLVPDLAQCHRDENQRFKYSPQHHTAIGVFINCEISYEKV
uniref:Ricin B-type lectin domain-containing protein n=1 Tax=Heterorhabditis bacteriophora TaxID=37862 RepID=A0A1I7X895_HETBA